MINIVEVPDLCMDPSCTLPDMDKGKHAVRETIDDSPMTYNGKGEEAGANKLTRTKRLYRRSQS